MGTEWQFYRGKWRRIPQLKDTEGKKQNRIQNAIFQHGGENFTLRDFHDAYKDDLPKIIIATQGYDGGVDLDTIAMGQMMRIDSVCKQTRVIAKDSSGRNITIPLNYPLPFHVCTTKNKRRQDQLLVDIVSSHSLPVQVEFAVSDECRFDVGNTETRVKSFGKITVSEMYDESYCIANCICEGILETHTILIPLYLQNVLVSIVTGIKDMTQEHFQQFLEDIETAAKDIIFDEKIGNEDIALYKQVDMDTTQGDNIYETLEPDRFFRFAKDQEEYVNLSDSSHFQSREITQSAKKEIVPTAVSEKPIYRKKPLTPPIEPPGNESTDDIPPPLPPRHSVLSREDASSTSENRTSDYDYVKKTSYVRRGNEDYTGGGEDDYVNAANSADYVTRDTSDGCVAEDSSESDVKITSKEDYVTSNSEDDYVRGKAVFTKMTEGEGGERRLTGLSISEVGEVMKTLGLERHTDTFKKEFVDGCLLADFNEQILKEEFKFTGIETMRMMKFIRTGHIPH